MAQTAGKEYALLHYTHLADVQICRAAAVAPAGSGTFNYGTWSHPASILPIQDLIDDESHGSGSNNMPMGESSDMLPL